MKTINKYIRKWENYALFVKFLLFLGVLIVVGSLVYLVIMLINVKGFNTY